MKARYCPVILIQENHFFCKLIFYFILKFERKKCPELTEIMEKLISKLAMSNQKRKNTVKLFKITIFVCENDRRAETHWGKEKL